MPHLRFPKSVSSVSDGGKEYQPDQDGVLDTADIPGDVVARLLTANPNVVSVEDEEAAEADKKSAQETGTAPSDERATLTAKLQEAGRKVDGRTSLPLLRKMAADLDAENKEALDEKSSENQSEKKPEMKFGE